MITRRHPEGLLAYAVKTGYSFMSEQGRPGQRLMWLLFRSDIVWLEICLALISLLEFLRMQEKAYPVREAADYLTNQHGYLLASAHIILAVFLLHTLIYGARKPGAWRCGLLVSMAIVWLLQTAAVWDVYAIKLVSISEFYSTTVVGFLAAFAALRTVGAANVSPD